ncbi:MAG: MFS transporter [Bacillota bacterium]
MESAIQKEVRRLVLNRFFICAVLGFAYFISYFHRVSPTVIVDRLMSTFHIEGAVIIGNLTAIYFYIYALMQIPGGMLADRWGPRKLVSAGMFLAGTGALLFAFTPTVLGLYIGRLLIAFGVSVIYVSILKFQSTWFRPDQVGTFAGVLLFVGNLGAIVAATPLAAMVSLFDWRISFGLIGLVTFLIAIFSAFIIIDSPGNCNLRYPQEVFLRLTGANVTSKNNLHFNVSGFKKDLGRIFKNKYTWFAILGSFGTYGTLMALSGAWGVPYFMQVYGLTREEAANYVLLMVLGLMIGSPLVGYISDYMGTRKLPYLIFSCLYFVTWLILVFWVGKPPESCLYPVCFCLGFFGSSSMLSMVYVKEMNPADIAGLAVGCGNIGGFLGTGVMQPLVGYILDRHWAGEVISGVKIYSQAAYFKAFLVCFAVAAMAFLVVSFLREERQKIKH